MTEWTCSCAGRKEYDKHSEEQLVEWYKGLLSYFPPVLHEYFLKSFPEPLQWVEARNRFGRTSAVWSMVGHVVGLGDRHGENILIDYATGVSSAFSFLISSSRLFGGEFAP